jgi:peroxiredoxin 2/4
MKKVILIVSMLCWLAINPGIAQSQERNTIPFIGETAPSFTAESTNGTIHFPSDYGRSWKILFSHPRDFTPVCSTEILELAYAEKEFEKLGAKLVVLSTDQLDTHYSWKAALEQVDYQGRGLVKIGFPLVEDSSYVISELYGMTHPEAKRGANIRGVYFIDRNDRVRAINFYPAEVGRNTAELLRTLIALQKTDDDFNVVTPANWTPGKPVMVAHPNMLMEENLAQSNSIYFRYTWFMTFWTNEQLNEPSDEQ